MMQYTFYVLTDQGMKNATVTSSSDFDCAPFGFVPYRVVSTCECEPQVIAEFWQCVDQVLAANNLTSQNYVRAVRAYTQDGVLCGEYEISS
jgi:hypothetical protein